MSQYDNGIRLVYTGNGMRAVGGSAVFDQRNFEVFDLKTGERLLNVYRVELDVSRNEPVRLKLTIGAPFAYEGPVDLRTGTGDDR